MIASVSVVGESTGALPEPAEAVRLRRDSDLRNVKGSITGPFGVAGPAKFGDPLSLQTSGGKPDLTGNFTVR
jgi:hypothetical protein